MKRLLHILTPALASLALHGCGDNASTTGSTATPTDGATDPATGPTADPTADPAADSGAGSSEDTGPQPTPVGCEARAQPTLVQLQTEDGLTLEADLYPSGVVGGSAVVLLHMIPPSNDKSNFPATFIDPLRAAGYTVLNVNRRGAGSSEGVATDAYEGPNGRLDAVAAHVWLTESGCEVPPGAISIVAGSNGTTTAMDFAATAGSGARPAAMALLSPGAYTENQRTVAEEAKTLAAIPMLFAYPSAEASWPDSVAQYNTGAWDFREYPDGQHGTRLFMSNPEIIDVITEFLQVANPA